MGSLSDLLTFLLIAYHSTEVVGIGVFRDANIM